MSRDCPVTHRLSGPCVRSRQPAWPAHVRGLLIYCEACCGCGQGGAEAAGTDAAPVGARSGLACRMPLARATGVAIALERGGKAPRGIPPHPSSGLLGPFLAFRVAFYERRRPGLPGSTHRHQSECWPRLAGDGFGRRLGAGWLGAGTGGRAGPLVSGAGMRRLPRPSKGRPWGPIPPPVSLSVSLEFRTYPRK